MHLYKCVVLCICACVQGVACVSIRGKKRKHSGIPFGTELGQCVTGCELFRARSDAEKWCSRPEGRLGLPILRVLLLRVCLCGALWRGARTRGGFETSFVFCGIATCFLNLRVRLTRVLAVLTLELMAAKACGRGRLRGIQGRTNQISCINGVGVLNLRVRFAYASGAHTRVDGRQSLWAWAVT